jgi:hypothetical protein
MKYAVALITCLAVQSLPANALSGSELYQYCMEKKPSTGDAMCLAYVRGFIDGVTMGVVVGKNYPTKYCPPQAGIPVDQGRLIVEKYLRDHAGELHDDAPSLVGVALIKAFPCR